MNIYIVIATREKKYKKRLTKKIGKKKYIKLQKKRKKNQYKKKQNTLAIKRITKKELKD